MASLCGLLLTPPRNLLVACTDAELYVFYLVTVDVTDLVRDKLEWWGWVVGVVLLFGVYLLAGFVVV